MKKLFKGREKRIICTLLALLLSLCFMLSSCSTEPPALEEVKEEYSRLIAKSVIVNEFLFGAGLPVYERDGSEEDKKVYESLVEALSGYESVRADSPYLTIEAMKEEARGVYTEDYLESAFLMAFDGYADDIAGVTTARYLEWDGWLYQSMSYEPIIDEARMYDYESMKIVKPSNGEYVNVSIDSFLGEEKMNITLAFAKTENGWRLDTPTY